MTFTSVVPQSLLTWLVMTIVIRVIQLLLAAGALTFGFIAYDTASSAASDVVSTCGMQNKLEGEAQPAPGCGTTGRYQTEATAAIPASLLGVIMMVGAAGLNPLASRRTSPQARSETAPAGPPPYPGQQPGQHGPGPQTGPQPQQYPPHQQGYGPPR